MFLSIFSFFFSFFFRSAFDFTACVSPPSPPSDCSSPPPLKYDDIDWYIQLIPLIIEEIVSGTLTSIGNRPDASAIWRKNSRPSLASTWTWCVFATGLALAMTTMDSRKIKLDTCIALYFTLFAGGCKSTESEKIIAVEGEIKTATACSLMRGRGEVRSECFHLLLSVFL